MDGPAPVSGRADRSPDPPETAGPRAGWASAAAKILVTFAAAGVVVLLSRGLVGDGSRPPVGLLLAWGSVILLCTGGGLAWVVRKDLSLPVSVVGYALGYNALVVVVKFVLAPYGVYEVNRTRDLTGLIAIDQSIGMLAAAGLVFLLYAGVYIFVFRRFRRRLSQPSAGGRRTRHLVLVVLAASLLLAGATGGVALFIIPLVLAGAGLEYLGFVFTSGASLLVGMALAGATWLVVRTFREVSERAQLVGDATVLVSFFWVGLAFLALYHALWVVYMLIMITLWPLRAVAPK